MPKHCGMGCMGEALPLTEAMEDYLEAIYLIIAEKKVARAKDITARLGVSGASGSCKSCGSS